MRHANDDWKNPGLLGPCICSELRRAARKLSSLYDEGLKEAGITITQYSVLARVGRNDGITLSALALQLGTDRTTLTRTLKPLSAEQLLSEEIGSDKRERVLRLSPQGKRKVERAFALWREVQREMLAEFGESQWEKLQAELASLQEAAEKVALQTDAQ